MWKMLFYIYDYHGIDLAKKELELKQFINSFSDILVWQQVDRMNIQLGRK